MLSRRKLLGFGGAASALTLLNTCVGPFGKIPKHEPTPLEQLVRETTEHLARGEFSEAEKKLDRDYDYYADDAGYCAFRCIAQAGNKHYHKSNTSFRSLIDLFESNPEIVSTVRDRMRFVFPSEAYKETKKKLRKFAKITFPADLSDLWIVDGFLSMAEYKFDEAISAFKNVLPEYNHKLQTYKNIMDTLVAYSKRARDKIAEKGYQQIADFFQERLTQHLSAVK